MFCLGKELKDDLFLYSYDIIDDITVQALIKLWVKYNDVAYALLSNSLTSN